MQMAGGELTTRPVACRIAEYSAAHAKLLEQVVKGKCFKAKELPDVPDAARKPPKVKKQKSLFD